MAGAESNSIPAYYRYNRYKTTFYPKSLDRAKNERIELAPPGRGFAAMIPYDFKTFHTRSINAATPEERAAINQELKTLYTSLPDDQKEAFNSQLQHFLSREMGRLKSDYESMKGGMN